MSKKQPSEVHHAIANFLDKFSSSTLMTTATDNLHCLAKGQKNERKKEDFAFTDNVFEVHGNMEYMRCSNDKCLTQFFLIESETKC